MANCSKVKRSGAAAAIEHCERDERKNESTKNIDPARSSLNEYMVVDQYGEIRPREYVGELQDRFNERLNDVYARKDSRLNVMRSWCITLPQDVPREEEHAFFEGCVEFIRDRYGAENVIGGTVHYDEQSKKADGSIRPHVHVLFIPVTADHKHAQGWKVDSDSVVTKKDLDTFHPQLGAYLSQKLGHKIELLNGITKERGGNVSLSRYKYERETENAQKKAIEASRALLKAKVRERLLDEREAQIGASMAFLEKKRKSLENDQEEWQKDKVSQEFDLQQRENTLNLTEMLQNQREKELDERKRKMDEEVKAEVEKQLQEPLRKAEEASITALEREKEAADSKRMAEEEKAKYEALNAVLEENEIQRMLGKAPSYKYHDYRKELDLQVSQIRTVPVPEHEDYYKLCISPEFVKLAEDARERLGLRRRIPYMSEGVGCYYEVIYSQSPFEEKKTTKELINTVLGWNIRGDVDLFQNMVDFADQKTVEAKNAAHRKAYAEAKERLKQRASVYMPKQKTKVNLIRRNSRDEGISR